VKIFKSSLEKAIKNNDAERVMDFLKSRKSDLKLEAFQYLSSLNDSELNKSLKELISDKDLAVRTRAIIKFMNDGVDNIFTGLKEILVNGTRKDKIDMLRAISDIENKDLKDISSILALGLNDKDGIVKIETVRALGSFNDNVSIEKLLDCLESQNAKIRFEAIKSLGKMGKEISIEKIVGALVDNNYDVRGAARETLEKIGTEKAKNILKDAPLMLLVKKMNENESTREETARTIGKQKIVSAVPLLVKALQDEYKNVRLEVVRALGKLREESTLPAVKELLNDKFYDVRLETVNALEKFNSEIALNALGEAKKDKNKNVRDAAQKSYSILWARLQKFGKLKE